VDRLLTHLAPDGTKLLQRQEKTEGKITFYRYHAWYVPEMDTETEYFFFYMYIVESGVWRKLDRRAKALYLVLRANARFNFMRYCDVEGLDYSTFQKSGNLAHKWEECLVSVAELCRQVGMSNSHIHDAIRQLNRSGLIYYVVGRGFMVYQLPEVTPVDIEV
jgi:biotin operon repressor